MFDWLFEKRVRVRVRFVTCWVNFYQNEADTRWRLIGALADAEGTMKDKKLYLQQRKVTTEFYNSLSFASGGHMEPSEVKDVNEMDENAWIEFNCWESTFRKMKKSLVWYCYDAKIVGEVL